MPKKTKYTPQLAKEICDRIATGESLRSICRPDYMPPITTVMDWIDKYLDFTVQYARARELQADHLAAEIIEIADDSGFDARVDGSGNIVIDHDAINRARLRADVRKWYAGKLRPKVYGDRIETENKTTLEAGDGLTLLLEAINGQTRSK